ncbi:MAG: hypothetical protein ACFE9S_17585 [Candidatus Hermodarchaeota archaeon]
MVNLKRYTWLFALIASLLIIVSLFTPARIIHSPTYGEVINWLGGAVMYYLDTSELHDDLFSLLLFGIALISITILLTISMNIRKGNEIKRRTLIYLLIGTGLLIFPIFYWLFEFDPAFETISFASIGIFISGIISILAFAIDKFSINRSKKTLSQ